MKNNNPKTIVLTISYFLTSICALIFCLMTNDLLIENKATKNTLYDYPNQLYLRDFKVFSVDYNDSVIIIDEEGYLWCLNDNTLKDNQLLTAIMCDNGTKDITDDYIINFKIKE